VVRWGDLLSDPYSFHPDPDLDLKSLTHFPTYLIHFSNKMGFVFCTVSWAIDSTIVKNNKKSLFAPVYIFVKRKSKESIIKIFFILLTLK
jgi:hypothetical protein